MKPLPKTYRGNPSPVAIIENKLAGDKTLINIFMVSPSVHTPAAGWAVSSFGSSRGCARLRWESSDGVTGTYLSEGGSLQQAVDDARRLGLRVDSFI